MLPDAVWERHANPLSGWSRLLAFPVLIVAIYTRKWLALAATVGFLAVNPLLFPAPEEEPDAWMYRVVRAEQHWTDADNSLFGTDFPQVLNVLQIPAFLLALGGALKRRPLATIVGTAATMALKLWFVNELVKWDADRSNE